MLRITCIPSTPPSKARKSSYNEISGSSATKSFVSTYGGLLTIKSNAPSISGNWLSSVSLCLKILMRSLSLRLVAFSSVSLHANSLWSMATHWACIGMNQNDYNLLQFCFIEIRLTFGSACKSASDIAPEPQPISMNRIDSLLSNCCNINSTSSSVSGRGMNTGGTIFRTKSQKSHSPMMYWRGIRAARHSHSCSNRANCSSVRTRVFLAFRVFN